MKRSESIWVGLLTGLVALHALANAIWLGLNSAPPSWDPSSHTWIALDIAQKLRSLDIFGIFYASNYYPIFVHTVAALLLLIFGPNIILAQYVGTIFFALAIVMLFYYAKTLFQSSRIGFIAAALFSFFPIVFDQSRRLMLDVPLTAMLLVCLYLLEKTDNFNNKKTTIWFGVAVGLLAMTKWTGVLFLVAPLSFTAYFLLKSGQVAKVFRHIVLSIVAFAAVVAPWYLVNFASLHYLTTINIIGYADEPTRLISLQNLIYYAKLFINYQVTPIAALLFFLSIAYLVIAKVKRGWYLCLFLLTGYLFFTFINNKDPRYTIPLLPFVAITMAVALDAVCHKYKQVGILIVSFLIILAGTYWGVLTFRPSAFEGMQKSVQLPVLGWVNIIDINDWVVKKYELTTWPIDDALQTITKTAGANQARVLIAYEGEHFNPSTLQMYLKAGQLNNQYMNVSIKTPDIAYMLERYHAETFPKPQDLREYLLESDYILVSPDDLGTTYLRNKQALLQIQDYVTENNYQACSKYIGTVAPNETSCTVADGEAIYTGSDVSLNNQPVTKGGATITGFAKVFCPFGCSFAEVTPPNAQLSLAVTFITSFKLPTGSTVNLYRIGNITP